MGRLACVSVGRPQTVHGTEPWVTSFFKQPVRGGVFLGWRNLAGDKQADDRVHGGLDKAVCVYSAEHYPLWQRELGLPTGGPPAFGENFTVSEQIEAEVCIGDVYDIGEAAVEVSQPRGPCWKLARAWSRPELPKLVIESGRTGWYLRVKREGVIAADDEFRLVARPCPRWTVAQTNSVLYGKSGTQSLEAIADLASCPLLARSCRVPLAQRYLKLTQARI